MDLLERLEERDQLRDESLAVGAEEKNRMLATWLTIAVCAAVIIGAAVYVVYSRVIYHGDSSTYWDICRNIAKGKLSPNFWANVYNSIGTRENNYVSAVIPSFIMSMFGTSRLVYIMSIAVCYLIPSVIIIRRMAGKLSNTPLMGVISGIFMLPFTMYMMLKGYTDVGAVTLSLLCYSLYYGKDGPPKNIFSYIAIGVLLIFVMIFSSCFTFFSVSFLTAMCIDAMLGEGKRWYTLLTVITFGILALTVCLPFFKAVFFDIYGALSLENFGYIWSNVRLLTHCVGMLFIALIVILPFIARKKDTGLKISFIWAQIIVMAAVFLTTHRCEARHMLMFIPGFTMLALITALSAERPAEKGAIAVVIAGSLLGVCLSSRDVPDHNNIKSIAAVPTFSLLPARDDTAVQTLSVKRKLDAYVPKDCLCGVLGESELFGADMIRNAEESLRVDVNRNYEYIRNLPSQDERDSQRLNELYEIEYLLAAFPAQTYGEGGQTIIDEAAASFELYSDIATAFTEIEGFNEMIGDINVRLYRRDKDIGYSEINKYQQRLYY